MPAAPRDSWTRRGAIAKRPDLVAKTRIYFVTDLHGSSMCFRKFLNATAVYKPDVLVLGGDVAGKAIQSIVHQGGERWHCRFIGTDYDVETGPDLAALEKLINDHGYYAYRAEPGELEGMRDAGTLDGLFLRLMDERLTGWLQLADERLRPKKLPLYFMLGNDDPVELAELLDRAPWGVHDEGKVVWLDDEHEMISWGYANITPWHSHREQTEAQLTASYEHLGSLLTRPERAVFNVHVPPFGTQIDEAPKIDANLQVQAVLGQVQMVPVGSMAVRDWETNHQPLLGLHGHIHESSGIRRLGRSVIINPGSDYSTGALNGALVTLDRDKVSGYQLVRG
jgi:Icc-related predicted phosphoesterase